MSAPPPDGNGGSLSEEALRLEFARSLAAAAFAGRQRHRPATTSPEDEATRLRWAQAKRSAKLVADPRESRLYTPDVEQQRARSSIVSNTLPRLHEVCAIYSNRRSLDIFLRMVTKELELALWRCDVYIGLVKPGGNAVTYVACSSGSEILGKELRRGRGVSFQCIDRDETVMVGVDKSAWEALAESESEEEDNGEGGEEGVEDKEAGDAEDSARALDEGKSVASASASASSLPQLAPEQLRPETLGRGRDLPLVVVPLTFKGSSLGVIGIDGFTFSPDDSVDDDPQSMLWYKSRVLPFLENDDDAIKATTLYRSPPERFGAVEIKADPVAATVVQGNVIHVSRLNRALGPIYTVEWEDGLRETDIMQRAMQDMLKPSPKRYRHGTPATREVVTFVEEAAKVIGEHLDTMRKRNSITSLREYGLRIPLTVEEAWKAAMLTVIECLPFAQVVEVWEVNPTGRTITIIARTNPPNDFKTLSATRRPSEIPHKNRGDFFQLIGRRGAGCFEMPFAKAILLAPFDDKGQKVGDVRIGPKATSRFLLAVMRGRGRGEDDRSHCTAVAAELSATLGYIRGREQRNEQRRQSLERTRRICNQWALTGANELQTGVLRLLQQNLRGADVYFGMLLPGGEVLQYGIVSRLSHMSGQRLERGQGASFQAVETGAPIVVYSPDSYDTSDIKLVEKLAVDVRYGKRWFGAKITRSRGRDFYDVRFDTGEREAGVPADRIRAKRPVIPRVHTFEGLAPNGWPFVCVPLLNGNLPVGVCGIDNFDKVPKSHDGESHPEQGMAEFLLSAASYLGEALDRQRKTSALREIGNVTRDFEANIDEIGTVAMRALRDLIVFSAALQVYEGNGNLKYWQRLDWTPPVRQEHTTVSEGGNAAEGDDTEGPGEDDSTPNAIPAQELGDPFNADIEVSEATLKGVWGDVRSVAAASPHHEADRPRAETLEGSPETIIGRAVDRGKYEFISNPTTTPTPDDTTRYTLVVRRAPGVRYEEDVSFFNNVCRVIETGIICINGRAYRKQARKQALDKILELCRQWKDVESSVLLTKAVDALMVPLSGCCIYIGMLVPGGQAIEYTHSSPTSSMAGKRLKRGKGLSFRCIDEQESLIVKDSHSENADKLNFFVDRHHQGWPYIAVPLSRGISMVRGVLGIDSFESAGKGRDDDEQPEPGVLDFVSNASSMLGTMIDQKAKYDALTNMELATQDFHTTVEDVYRGALKALQMNVLFARVLEIWQIKYIRKGSSRPSSSQSEGRPSSRSSTPGNEGRSVRASPFPSLILIVHIMRAFNLPKLRKFGKNNAYCVVYWGDVEVGRSKVKPNSLSPEFDHRMVIPSIADWDSKSITFRVYDHVRLGDDSLIGECQITGNILLHMKPKGTTFQLRTSKDNPDSEKRGFLEVGMVMDVAEFTLPVELVPHAPTKVLCIDICGAKGLAAADFNGASDPYCVVYWNDEEVGRTSVIPETLNPVWADAHFEVPAPTDLLQAELVIDVYDHDDIGDHDFLGKVILTGEELAHPKRGKIVTNLQRDAGKVVPRAQKFVKGKLELKLSYREENTPKGSLPTYPAESVVVKAVYQLKGEEEPSAKDWKVDLPEERVDELVRTSLGNLTVSCAGDEETIISPVKDVSITIDDIEVGPGGGTDFMVVVTREPGKTWEEDVEFTHDVVRLMQTNIRCVRGRRQRECARNRAERLVKEMCGSQSSADFTGLFKGVIGRLERCLPGSNIYIGLLQPGGNLIKYVASTLASRMKGQTLPRGRGVSYDCIGSGYKNGLVIHESDEMSSLVHSFAEADDNQLGAVWPFICVPLVHNDCTVGILGVDDFNKVGKGREDDPHPEDGVVDLLQMAGVELGISVDCVRKNTALEALKETVITDSNISTTKIHQMVLRMLTENVLFSTQTEIWHLDPNWKLGIVAHASPLDVGTDVNVLDVTVMTATSLPGQSLGRCSPSVVVSCAGKATSTTVKRQARTISWNEKLVVSVPSSEQNIRLDVYDAGEEPESSKKRGKHIGTALMPMTDLGQGTTNVALTNDAGKAGTLQVMTEWQEKEATAEIGGDNEGQDQGRFEEVEITLVGAKGLPKADVFGSSDPYIKVIWEAQEVHKTAVVKNNLNPEWDNESVVIRVRIPEDDQDSKVAEALRLEVYDYDRVGSHDLLGFATIPVATLIRPRRVLNELELEGDAKKPGTLSVEVRTAGNAGPDGGGSQVVLSAGKLKEGLDVEVNILNAKDLAKADTFGKSDPFVEVKWNGKVIHKTKTKKSTLNPVWEDEKIIVSVRPDGSGGRMTLEVYDADLLTRGDFLGQVVLSSTELLFPPSEKMTYTLQPKPGMSEKALKLVQGTITLQPKVLTSLEKERVLEMKPLPEGASGDGASEEGTKIEIALDLEAERQRWEQDKLTLPSIVERVEELATKVKSAQSDQEQQVLISEVDAGQLVDAWLRKAGITTIPGTPKRIFVPFADMQSDTKKSDSGSSEPSTSLSLVKTQRAPPPGIFDMGNKYAVVMTCTEFCDEDRLFVNAVSEAIEEALEIVAARERRRTQRLHYLERIQAFCSEASLDEGINAASACVYVMGLVKACLPSEWDTTVLLPSSKERMLRYVASSAGDVALVGRELFREHSVAFDCMDHGYAVIVEEHQARLGHVAWPSFVSANLVDAGLVDGVHLYDVATDPSKIVPDEVLLDLELHILHAKNLAKADWIGSSDPFVEVFWNEELIHKTKTIKQNLNPVWTHEKFLVSVNPDGSGGELVLRLYDADLVTKDFMGQIVLPSTEVFHQAVANSTMTHKLEPKEGMSEKALKLVQGTLTFSAKCLSDLPSNAEEDAHEGEDPPELPQGRFAPAVPIATTLSDMHDIIDGDEVDYMMVPLWAHENGRGVLGVRMAKLEERLSDPKEEESVADWYAGRRVAWQEAEERVTMAAVETSQRKVEAALLEKAEAKAKKDALKEAKKNIKAKAGVGNKVLGKQGLLYDEESGQYLPAAEVEKKVQARLEAVKEKERLLKEKEAAKAAKKAAKAAAKAAKAEGKVVDDVDQEEEKEEEDDKPKSSPTPDTNPLRGYKAASTGLGRWLGGGGSSSGGGEGGGEFLSLDEDTMPPVSWEELFAWVGEQGENTMPASAKYMDADVLSFLRSAGLALGTAVDRLIKQECIREVLEKATVLYTHDVYAKACAVFMRTFPRIRNIDVWQFISIKREKVEGDVFGEEKGDDDPQSKYVVFHGLRSILDEENDELDPVDEKSIPSMEGELGWPRAAMAELDETWTANCRNGVSKPFRINTGQVVVPFEDRGVNGSLDGRRHAFVLQGDPRFTWDSDADGMMSVAKAAGYHIRRLRREREAEIKRELEAAEAARKEAAKKKKR